MKTLTTTATDKLAKLLSGLPEIQKIISDENDREKEKAIQARMGCINLLIEAQQQAAKARAVKDAALSKLQAARAAAKEGEVACFTAVNASNEADSTEQNLTMRLNKEHGEGQIHHAMFILNRLADDSKNRLAALEANRYDIFYLGDGRPFSRTERRKIKTEIEIEEGKMEPITKSIKGLKKLLLCRATPDEIAAQVANLLASAGYTPNADAPTLI